jgi:hypothetical protein
MARTRHREGRVRESTDVSAPVTLKEMDNLLEDIKKIDPKAKFTGRGQYVVLVGSRDWTREEMKQVQDLFVLHQWKVKFEI